MSLKPLIWWIFLNFLPWKLKRKTEWSLKCACHSAAFSGTECPLKGHWTVPEIRISVNIPWAFSGHSEMFQLIEWRIFILWLCKSQFLFMFELFSSVLFWKYAGLSFDLKAILAIPLYKLHQVLIQVCLQCVLSALLFVL